jgi:hypothetical protein
MQGPAPGSPKTRGIADLDQRIALIEKFEAWGNVERLPIRECVGEEEWRSYWARCDIITAQLREAQVQANRIKSKLTAEFEVRQPSSYLIRRAEGQNDANDPSRTSDNLWSIRR